MLKSSRFSLSYIQPPCELSGIKGYLPPTVHTHKMRPHLTEQCLHAQSHIQYVYTHFLSRLSLEGAPPRCDYNSNAIFPLYVNVYYFSRYIRSPLLLQPFVPPFLPLLFHPLHISIYIIELLIGLCSLPSALMQATFRNPKHNFMAKMTQGDHSFFFFSLCLFLM